MQRDSHEMILIIDFGGQGNQQIAHRVRACGVYCEIVSNTCGLEEIKAKNPKGIILSGGAKSVFAEDAPSIDERIFNLGIPVLGVAYGHQLMAKVLGGTVAETGEQEIGQNAVKVNPLSPLFRDIEEHNLCYMNYVDYVSMPPSGFEVTSVTRSCPVAAMADEERNLYGVQFNPEVDKTPFGKRMINNFLFNICGAQGDWTMNSFVKRKIQEIKDIVGDKKVLCAVSGGVDSSVAAVLVHQAVGKQLTCVFVDSGLLRKDEGDQVESIFKEKFDMNIIRVNATDRFIGKLQGVTGSERKRKAIGEEFIRVFEEEAKKLGKVDFFVQGTIYTDVLKSETLSATPVKVHHNVCGLPEDMEFQLLEPLRELFKDEVRIAGEELGIPTELVWRQPFPGPGLAIRVLGEVTPDKLALVREADAIFREEIDRVGLQRRIWQYFAILPDLNSVGIVDDERTNECHTIALRAVTSSDGTTSDWAHIPLSILDTISRRIVKEVSGVNRVVYDITAKPPATIEWE